MSDMAKKFARRRWRRLTARHDGGIPTDRVPSAEGVRLAFSSMPTPGFDRKEEVGGVKPLGVEFRASSRRQAERKVRRWMAHQEWRNHVAKSRRDALDAEKGRSDG